jgi:hypothetical protein
MRTAWLPLGSSSTKVRPVAAGPVVFGANATLTEQVVPGARVAPVQPSLAMLNAADWPSRTAVTVSGAVPSLVRTIACVAAGPEIG